MEMGFLAWCVKNLVWCQHGTVKDGSEMLPDVKKKEKGSGQRSVRRGKSARRLENSTSTAEFSKRLADFRLSLCRIFMSCVGECFRCEATGVCEENSGGLGAKKWEYLVSQRSIPSQNLYRDEKTISFRFTIANIGGMMFSAKQNSKKMAFFVVFGTIRLFLLRILVR